MKIPEFKIVQWPTVGIIKHRNEIYTANLHSSNFNAAIFLPTIIFSYFCSFMVVLGLVSGLGS